MPPFYHAPSSSNKLVAAHHALHGPGKPHAGAGNDTGEESLIGGVQQFPQVIGREAMTTAAKMAAHFGSLAFLYHVAQLAFAER